MTCRNFSLQKENDCKVQLRFLKCCTLVVTEGYHILLSPRNKLVTCHLLCRGCISWEPAGHILNVSVNGAGGSEPLRRGFRAWSPLRKFLDSKEYLDWLKDTGKTFVLVNSVQEFIEI